MIRTHEHYEVEQWLSNDNYNWETAQPNMAFEDTEGNILWFSHNNSTLTATFTDEYYEVTELPKLSLIRLEQFDNRQGDLRLCV